jgi:hypothetical protein
MTSKSISSWRASSARELSSGTVRANESCSTKSPFLATLLPFKVTLMVQPAEIDWKSNPGDVEENEDAEATDFNGDPEISISRP